ncbi:MAG: SDR family oxidoreductase [Alphaproteobacteria bacterium]|nr:SDR family oxidoreductase [Alphaproteobacteria bacterium]
MSRTLVVGSTGLLGQALMRVGLARGLDIIGAARREAECILDITNPEQIMRTIATVRPAVLINTAAIVDLNACNADPGLAFVVNARAVGILGQACAETGARLIHVSTDHYFSGDGRAVHDEKTPILLLNDYARSKFAGERFALLLDNALVVRTNVVGLRGWRGKPTFAEWCLESLAEDAEVSLFDDYFTSPIDADHLAEAILDLAGRPEASGLLNVAGREVVSKEAFYRSLARDLGIFPTRARSGSVRSLPVRRADSCGLDVRRAEALLGRRLPGLAETTAAIARAHRRRLGAHDAA